jgi:hypothetical protein
MVVTEKHEHALTQKALDTLAEWGKDLPGENIGFSLTREGAPSDAFIGMGDCTPFTPSGKRGVLHGQPVGDTGAPVAYLVIPAFAQVPFAFSFDLNKGEVSLNGAFPPGGDTILAPTLTFTVEYIREFDANDGTNILFHSEETSDNAGYIIAVQLVGA